MKTNIRLFVVVIIGAAATAMVLVYLRALNVRTTALEARLAQLEVEVKGIQPKVLVNTPPAINTPPAMNRFMPQSHPSVMRENSLEARVTKIEQELTPHAEPLEMARR